MTAAELERRAKIRTVRSLRSQLDHLLMLRAIGQPVDAAQLERIGDQLSALARTAPELTLADIQ